MRCSASDGSLVGWGAVPLIMPRPILAAEVAATAAVKEAAAAAAEAQMQVDVGNSKKRVSFTRKINVDACEIECKLLRKKSTLYD